jgi:hypothetical protein
MPRVLAEEDLRSILETYGEVSKDAGLYGQLFIDNIALHLAYNVECIPSKTLRLDVTRARPQFGLR